MKCRLTLLAVVLVAPLGGVRAASESDVASADMESVRAAWKKGSYQFTPEVKTAYLKWVKARVHRKLAALGRKLPSDFLAWIDSDPLLEAAVYGSGQDPADVLLMLRSLEIDLGQEAVRKKYTQLALATAVVFAKEGEKADLSARQPLKLAIGGDPRKPVDTKDPNRALDLNDHIINFLNDNSLEEEVVVGRKEELPELKYDEKGVAIAPPKKRGKSRTVPVTEKRTRTLYAADVIASRAWQEKFNAYMKEKGQDVRIDCGEKVVSWNSHAMVRGEEHRKIAEAYKLFRTAYEAKGLLPAQRDPKPTPAEQCAYLIRNDEYRFPADLQAQRKWPRYPLTAPWPTLTLLVANGQPLREREERWEAFRDRGEFRTYGEYIGSIAQQGDMQAARRLTPFAFSYGSIQMALKDGGVCGAMANISVRSHCTLGVPACTAGQPGHCALILFQFDPKTQTYKCHGAQYATGGDAQTHPHGTWVFGDTDGRRPMVYHQSIAWAVNYGLAGYLDSALAYSLFRQLSDADRQAHGLELLASGLALNPYNLLLIDAGFAQAASAADAVRFWKDAARPFASFDKPGCPSGGLYDQTVREKLFSALVKLPVPADAAAVSDAYAFLQEAKCDNPAALLRYQAAVVGLPAVLADVQTALKSHLESPRNPAVCAKMAATFTAAAGLVADKNKRREWALECWQIIQGRECFLGPKDAITLDPTVVVLAKLAGQKRRPEVELHQPLLNQIVSRLKAEIDQGRTPKGCASLAKTIEALAKQVSEGDQKRNWLEELSQVIRGQEEYTPRGAKKNAKPLRDPCADAIGNLLKPPAQES